MSNTNPATAAGTVWFNKVNQFFGAVPPFNDVNSTQAQTLFSEILVAVGVATFPLVQEYQGLLVKARDDNSNNEITVNHIPLMIQLQNALNDRQNVVCSPQLLKEPKRQNLQGLALRDCSTTATTSCSSTTSGNTIVNLVTSQNGIYNDVQISADSTVMVAAGSGTARRFTPNQQRHDPFRKCTEKNVTPGNNMSGPADETLKGINIYVRATCNKTGTCTEAQISGLPDWRLVQSALLDATIQNVHLSNDGLSIVAYDLSANTVYVLRNNSCSNLRLWETVEEIPLEPPTGIFQFYGICGVMHASENQSHIVVTNKNLTTGMRKVYVLTNGAACEQVDGILNTNVSRTAHTLVQTILDQTNNYTQMMVSRDGQTLVLEFGTSSPAQSFPGEVGNLAEAAGSIVENGALGLHIYHWQKITTSSCICQYVLRQTINYVGLPTNYDVNQSTYLGCTTGRTIQLFFAGSNDDRIMRLIDRDQFVSRDVSTGFPGRIAHFFPPGPIFAGWQQHIAESPVLQVFDREEQQVDICGKPVVDCRQGIVNQEGSNVKRGVFVNFVAAPSVYLQGCDFRNEPYNMLYTHRVNKHIFVTWCSFIKAIHIYVESEVDNEWIQVPSSVYPFDYLATTAADQALGYRGYLAFTEDPNCAVRSNVCFPLTQNFFGQFVFRTISTSAGGTPGFYNGNTNSFVDLGNANSYITPSDHFVATEQCTNLPFLGKFPVTKTTLPNPNKTFTRATGPIAELPGVSVPPQIPFPLEFNVWQRWPKTDPRFPKCRTGYFKLSPESPFLRIGCDTTVEFVLTPRFYGFDPMSGQPEPDPNTEPRWIFSRAIAPVYLTLSTVCVKLVCAEKNCRAARASFPYYYRSGLVSSEIGFPCAP